ncbi:hypothetical protein EXS72_01340 [Candidatus Pacearchaeota archaeon]|nr:hypothetical protein [Candidatus Pacearchaeota archaeon]
MEYFQNINNKIFEKWNSLVYSNIHKYSRRIILLTIIGFFLRFIAARNLDVLADDMVYASQSAGIISAKLISTHSNPPLFFYLTDLAYNIFGYTTLASRFWPLIAGTLLIPLIYLISNHLLKDKKASFFAAFFVASCSFLIRLTFTEQSLVAMFFIFSGIYMGILLLDKPRTSYFILFSCLFGLSLLTKYNAPFFILSFGAYYLWYTKLNKFVQKISLKNFLYLFAILLLFSTPFLSFNYIIYQQKGIVDVYFSRLVHLNSTQELYGSLGGQENSFLDNLLNLSNYGNYNLPFMTDKILLVFATYGLWRLFKNKDTNSLAFIFLFLGIPFILQSAGAPLAKHFSFIYLLLAIPAGKGLASLDANLKNKKNLKIAVYSSIVIGLIFSLGIAYGTPSSYIFQGPTAQLKSFINEEISDNSLLVFDSRIYTARSMWLATDRAYLTFEQATSFFEQIFARNITQINPTPVYFIECVIEDCGWGWVSTNQNLNNSAENLISVISEKSDIVTKINQKLYAGNELKIGKNTQEYYRVYSTIINIPTPYLPEIKKSQNFYFTPYLYLNLENYLYNYNSERDPFTSLINNTSYIIIFVSVILSLLSLFLVFFFLFKSDYKN